MGRVVALGQPRAPLHLEYEDAPLRRGTAALRPEPHGLLGASARNQNAGGELHSLGFANVLGSDRGRQPNAAGDR
jgi:hypothetical protein